MTRPSETITAIVGSIVGAVLIIVGSAQDGFDLTDLSSAEVGGAVVLLISWLATGVTFFVSRRQRSGELHSGPAGEVQKAA